MSHFQCDPVLIHVRLYNIQLVIVQIPCCPPGRNAEDRRSVAAADATPSVGQPFFVAQIARVYQLLRLIHQAQHHFILLSSMPAAVPHASAREPLCDDTPQTAAAVLRDAISFVISFGYRLSFFAETPNQSSAAFAGSFPNPAAKSLKYTKYSCASQALSCAKISRRTLLPIDSGFRIYPQSLSAFGQKNSGNILRRSFFCVAVIPAICGRCAQKRNPAETCPADMAILPEIVKA